MSPLRHQTQPQVIQRSAPSVPTAWAGALNTLRVTALECRVAARADLFRACAVLSTEKGVAQEAYVQALMKGLREALNTKPVFYRPGATAVSFDEAWLMRAISAVHAGDRDSLTFLIRSRVPRLHQRNIAFLIQGMSEQFPQI